MSAIAMPSARIDFLDDARALAMITIYLAHILERFSSVGFKSTLPVWQVICAVTVPLFFFVSGIIAKPDSRPLHQALPLKAKRLFMPVIFFSVLMLPGWILQGTKGDELLSMAALYLQGLPVFQWVTWYLIAYFWIELICLALFSIFGARHSLSWLWCAVFIVAGGIVTPALVQLALKLGLQSAFWFIAESLVGAAFFFAGHAAKPWLLALPKRPWVGLLGATFAVATFYAAAHIEVPLFDRVVPPLSVHGKYPWFVLTAFLGITAMLLLARMLPANIHSLQFIGRNTLLFMGLNGICFHFLDIRVATLLQPVPDLIYLLLPIALIYIAVIFALFTPIAHLLKRYCGPLLGLTRP